MYEITYQNAGQQKPRILKIKRLDWENLYKAFKKEYPTMHQVNINHETGVGVLEFINEYGERKISFRVKHKGED